MDRPRGIWNAPSADALLKRIAAGDPKLWRVNLASVEQVSATTEQLQSEGSRSSKSYCTERLSDLPQASLLGKTSVSQSPYFKSRSRETERMTA